LRTLSALPKHIKTWQDPTVSCFVFILWMHIVHSNSLSLIPFYFVLFLIFMLVRNYVFYGSRNSLIHNGFAPASLEELVCVLFFGQEVKPLYLRGVLAKEYEKMEPGSKATVDHNEFPFSDGDRYLKKTIATSSSKESMKKKFQYTANALFDEEEEEAEESSGGEEEEEYGEDEFGADKEEFGDYEDLDVFSSMITPAFSVATTTLQPIPESRGINLSSFDNKTTTAHSKLTNPGQNDEVKKIVHFTDGTFFRRSKLWKVGTLPLPEQDILKRSVSKTTLTEEFVEFREKMHKATFRLFDDRPYYIAPSTDSTLGERAPDSKEKEEERQRELDTILGIQASHNPLVSKFEEFFKPLIQIGLIQNCVFRAGFNLFMWKDPYLSFWGLASCFVLLTLLVVFPWRPFLYALGLFFVGPQNWLLRVIKHKLNWFSSKKDATPNINSKTASTQIQPQDKNHIERSKQRNDRKKKGEFKNQSYPPGSIFHGHSVANNSKNPKQDVPISITYDAVVPYSPLLYNRFYDWPPDRRHNNVKASK